MLIVEVLLSAAALLLIVAGVTKLRAPLPAYRAARTMTLPANPGAIRILAVIEIVLGVAVILTASGVARVALGVLYAVFLVFVVAAIARNAPINSCGCFGSDDAPPSLVHVAINATAAAVAFVAAADGIDSPLDVITDSLGDALVVVIGAIVLTALAAAVLSGRLGARRSHGAPRRVRR